MKSTHKKIAEVLSRTAMIPEESVLPEATFDELGLSSFDRIECVLALEEAFQKEIPQQNLWELSTVQDIIDAFDPEVAEEKIEG